MKQKTKEDYDREYEEWLAANPLDKVPDVDKDELREEIVKELTYCSQMSVQEFTLYEKWREINNRYPVMVKSTLLGDELHLVDESKLRPIRESKANVWIPESPEDYLKLEPELCFTNNGGEHHDLMGEWTNLRVFVSTMTYASAIGRNLHFLIRDKVTKKSLGIIAIASDFMDLTCRDEYIGWSREIKTDQKMINHTAIGATIIPTQPLGYNFLGGKLCALLCLSEEVQDTWERLYNEKLVAMTTTSLYGSLSQYNSLAYWNKRGKTKGGVTFNPGKAIRKKMMLWLQKEEPRKYWEWYHGFQANGQRLKRDFKNRSMMYVYRQLDIPQEIIKKPHQRGVYFCPFYTNSCEFLRKEIPVEALEKRFDQSTQHLVDLWKEKYAGKRVKKLVESGKYNTEELFYDDLIYLQDFEEVKAKYLSKVGADR